MADEVRPAWAAVMVFDGDCSFCWRWVRRWRVATAGVVEFRAYQEAAGEFPEASGEEFGRAVHLFEEGGTPSKLAVMRERVGEWLGAVGLEGTPSNG